VRDLQPAKAFFAMEVTVTGITIAVKELHPSKVLLLILPMLPPIVTDVKNLHPKNAELPYDCNNYYMRVMEVMNVPMAVTALPSVIDTTGVSKKAEAPYDCKVLYYDMRKITVMIVPIDVTPLPNVADVNDVHPKNAESPYDYSYILLYEVNNTDDNIPMLPVGI